MYGIYRRCSKEAEDRLTLKTQWQRCVFKCKSLGVDYVKDPELYTDDGVTGATTDRPGFKRLMRDAKHKKIDGIVAWKLDRFSRNARDMLNTLHELEQYGCDLEFVEGGLTTKGATGKMMATVFAAVAEWERANIRDRMVENKKTGLKEGRLSQGKPPYGWKYVKGEGYELEPDEAKNIRQIYKLYIKGKGYIEIAEKFGLRKDRVKAILSSTVYHTGKWIVTMDGDEYPQTLEPIIDMETFEKAQLIHKHQKSRTRVRVHLPKLFKNKLICGLCGEHFHEHNVDPDRGYTYYRHKCPKAKSGFTESSQELDENLWGLVIYQLANITDEQRRKLVLGFERGNEELDDLMEMREVFEKDIEKLDRESEKLVAALTGRRGTKFIDRVEKAVEANDREIGRLRVQIEELDEKIEKVKESMQLAGQKNKILEQVKRQYKKYVGIEVPFNEKRALIDKLFPDYSIIYHPPKKKGDPPILNLHGSFYMSSDDM